VQLRYAELVYPDGMINRANFRAAKPAQDVHVSGIREGDHVAWEDGHYTAGDPGVIGAL
jgi:hypothetical protein